MQDVKNRGRGTWVAQSVKHPTLAQVMVLCSVSSSSASGSVLIAQSWELALDSVFLSVPLPRARASACALSLALSQKQILKKIVLK